MKQNIAFFICCIGMGHFTQAITVANYIKDKYKFKYIFCSCTADCNDDEIKNRVKNSILYKDKATIQIGKAHILQTRELTNILKTQASILYYNTKYIPALYYYIKKYNISLCLDFFTNFYDVFRYPSISISRQLISMNQYIDNPLQNGLKHRKHVNVAICLSNDDINSLNKYNNIDFDIPPLIDITEIPRDIIPNTCLIYIRDAHYCKDINIFVKNNHHIQFSIFTNHIKDINQEPNVSLSKPSDDFKEKLKKTQILITSSGVESICEAHYNNIPIIVLKPDEGDKEQTHNYNYYVKNNMATPFSKDINLVEIANTKINNEWFKEYCKTADYKINEIIHNVISKPVNIYDDIVDMLSLPLRL